MKRLVGAALLCAMAMSVISGCAPAEVTEKETETLETTGATELRPQDDYYRYINGDTLSNAVFEYGSHYFGAAADSSLVDSQIESVIKDVVAGSGYEQGSEEYGKMVR